MDDRRYIGMDVHQASTTVVVSPAAPPCVVTATISTCAVLFVVLPMGIPDVSHSCAERDRSDRIRTLSNRMTARIYLCFYDLSLGTSDARAVGYDP